MGRYCAKTATYHDLKSVKGCEWLTPENKCSWEKSILPEIELEDCRIIKILSELEEKTIRAK